MRRSPAPVLQDRDEARDLVAHEPDAVSVLHDLLTHIDLPHAGQAVVLGARLGGLARAFARRNPSWLVTALDPSVALLSASLDAIHPAGLSTQLTVLQAAPERVPLPPSSVHAIVGDLPLAHLTTRIALDDWASSCAAALQPSGVLSVRVAAHAPDPARLDHAIAHWPAPYRRLLRPVWKASFSTSDITAALHQAGLRDVVVHPSSSLLPGVAHRLVARS